MTRLAFPAPRLAAVVAAGLIAAATTVATTTSASANDTITVKWTNNTGKTINTANTYCAPSGTCTYPTSISNGSTGTIKQTASSSTYMRSITYRYRYYDFNDYTYKSCQIMAWVTKESGGCGNIDSTLSFQRTDGTGSSPTCTKGTVVQNPTTCDYTINVSMSN